MGELKDACNIKIANLPIGQFLLFPGQPAMTDEEARKAFEDLQAAEVPGFQEWMLDVPRRRFN